MFETNYIDKALKDYDIFQHLKLSYLINFHYLLPDTFTDETIYTDSNGSILRLFLDTHTEYINCEFGYIKRIRCDILLVILEIMRNQYSIEKNLLFDKNLRDLYDYCCEHYMECVKLSDLCEEIHYSLPYISKKFKDVTGQTFTNFLQTRRISESLKLLVLTEKNVSEISSLVDIQILNVSFRYLEE